MTSDTQHPLSAGACRRIRCTFLRLGRREKPKFFIDLWESRFPVTRNLEEALRHLRFPDFERMLWVDALCINQEDKEEKEAQVNSMHRIYNLARSVIAWSGPANEGSRSAFSTMDLIQKLDIPPPSSQVMILQISNQEICNEHDLVGELLDRPYWSRAWIVQEMMFARSLFIQCGSEVALYSILEKVYPFDKQGYHSDPSDPTRIYFRGYPESKLLRQDSKQLSPERFLDCFLDRECSERHDNIFAFLNLLGNDIQKQIKVDWKKDIRKLIRHTTEVIIKSTQSLYIIVIRGRQTPPNTQEDDKWQLDMPSWCPYFATPYNCCSIKPQYKPSLFAEKAVSSFANDRLGVKGLIIGRVSQTVSRNIQPGVGTTTWRDQVDIESEWKHYQKCLNLGLDGMPKDEDEHTRLMSKEATTRTLLAGRGEVFSDVETLLYCSTEKVEPPGIVALRKIWDVGNSRLDVRRWLSSAEWENATTFWERRTPTLV
ncbi:heterokaryon incompatibility protein-domain-containing protein [Leptodontidium sp. 2 PMI_412]|nr:heterokaryon incompatibility protein-domain-containing protein [Leptodontidium sp. 2 PMI_412]